MEVGQKMENEKKVNMQYEETELCLGLPGGEGRGDHGMKNKRGFEEIVDLKLTLISSEVIPPSDQNVMIKMPSNHHPTKPPAKAEVVGWPPVRSFRKNILAVQKISHEERENIINSNVNAAFVKVSMDGAPYLRKVDLKMYKGYKELSDALVNLFSSFTIGNYGMKDFMNESKLMDLLSGSDFVPTYEDKDGDWMLAGDVPWEMFVDSCKRLRIMKGTDAKGLAPRRGTRK